MKMYIFGTKNALFGYFWVKILKKLLSYLISAPSNLSNCNTSRKNKNFYIWEQKCFIWIFLAWNLKKILTYLKPADKMTKFGTKNDLFGYFWARIFKKPLSYLKSTTSNLSHVSLWYSAYFF